MQKDLNTLFIMRLACQARYSPECSMSAEIELVVWMFLILKNNVQLQRLALIQRKEAGSS
jgi:hypothetical protein